MKTQMKDIKGYEGLYAVTRSGKVWSFKTKKYIKQVVKKEGARAYVYLNKNGVKGWQYVEVLQYEAWGKEIKNPIKHKVMTEETKKKISETLKNKNIKKSTKKVKKQAIKKLIKIGKSTIIMPSNVA